MRLNKQDIFLSFVFLFLLGYLLYLVFYKPVEGFFAKDDACAIARRNKDFIQNQILDVSNNLLRLQQGLDRTISIRREVQNLLTQNNCLNFETRSATCQNLVINFQNLDTQIKTAVVQRKTIEDSIAEANRRIPQLQAEIDTESKSLATMITILTTSNETVDCKVGSPKYLGAESCSILATARTAREALIASKRTELTNFQTRLTTLRTNLKQTQDTLTAFDFNFKNIQDQLATNGCIVYKPSFLCRELSGQLSILDILLNNSLAEQTDYKNFFTSKSTPIVDINTLLQNAC